MPRTEELTALGSLISLAIKDYNRTHKGEYAAAFLVNVGLWLREMGTELKPQGQAPMNPDALSLILKAVEYWDAVRICPGDGFDQAHRCDCLVTGWLMARYYLRDHLGNRQISLALASARAAIAEIEGEVDERDAMGYIRNQPPMLFMSGEFADCFHGTPWRMYYARVARDPNAQAGEYPEILDNPDLP